MQHYFFCLTFFAIIAGESLSAKVRILTFHCNRPEFIELQYKTFKKFLVDDFEIIVFNDGKTSDLVQEIQAMCSRYGIQCIRFEPNWHIFNPLNDYIRAWAENRANPSKLGFSPFEITKDGIYTQPSIRHCHIIQYALDHYGYCHNDIVAIVDGDCFPIMPISLRKHLEKWDILGSRSQHPEVDYFWVVFVAFDPRRLPSCTELKFHLDIIDGTLYDSGAHSYHYLKNHPSVRAKTVAPIFCQNLQKISEKSLKKQNFKPDEIKLIQSLPKKNFAPEFHLNKHFLHFRATSYSKVETKKTECVTEFLKGRMKSTTSDHPLRR